MNQGVHCVVVLHRQHDVRPLGWPGQEHRPDARPVVQHVRDRGQSGLVVLDVSFVEFDPLPDIVLPTGCGEAKSDEGR